MRRFARRQAGKIALLGIGLFLGAAAAALATGQVFVTNGELNACAQLENGKLRLASADDPCKEQEEALSWNVQGPTGPVGPPGPRGEPGPAGASSLDALAGTPCTIRGQTGTTALSAEQRGFGIQIYCLARDEFEPNDSRETARSVEPSFTLALAPSIFPAGDHDWFAVKGRIFGWMVQVPLDAQVQIELYRDGTLVASETVGRGALFNFSDPSGGTEADWLLHVSGTTPTAYFVSAMGAFPPPPQP
jgi:hypothetical protein